MQPDTTAASARGRPPASTVAGLTATAIVSAVIPVAAGLAFLISLAVRRPLIVIAVRRWPWLTGHPARQVSHRTMTGLTAAWGIVMLAVGAIQGAGAITGGLTLTNPVSFTIRALIALAAEAVLAAISIACLRRRTTLSPQAR